MVRQAHANDHAAPDRTPSRKASSPAFTPKTVESVIGREAEQIQGGHKRVAVALDRSPTWVSRMKDPSDPTHLTLQQLPAACQAVSSVKAVDALFEGVRIDGSEWRMQRVPESIAAEDVQVASMELVAQVGEYMGALSRRISDGLTRRERAELTQELRVLQARTEALIAGLGR